MSNFKKLNTVDELETFVEEYVANRNLLKSKLTEAKIGEANLEKDIEQFQKPIIEKIDEASKLIPKSLTEMPDSVVNKLVLKLQDRPNLSIAELIREINVDDLGNAERQMVLKWRQLPPTVLKEIPVKYADEIVNTSLYTVLTSLGAKISANQHRPSYDKNQKAFVYGKHKYQADEVFKGTFITPKWK